MAITATKKATLKVAFFNHFRSLSHIAVKKQCTQVSQLQNSGWMNGNPTLGLFLGWNEMLGGSMERNSSSEMDQSGEVDRRS